MSVFIQPPPPPPPMNSFLNSCGIVDDNIIINNNFNNHDIDDKQQQQQHQQQQQQQKTIVKKKTVELNQCLWAINTPVLQRAFYLSGVCLLNAPLSCKYLDIPPILQTGPTCGLLAISMLFNGNPSLSALLNQAKNRKFSNIGEMFSAENMLELLDENIKGSNIVRDQSKCIQVLYKRNINTLLIKEALINGAVLLVPYDADVNHTPCLKKGHKAHWSLIVGYVIDENNQFYVMARHGKSRNLAIWSLESLAASNSNLTEFSKPLSHQDAEFILPEGGISGKYGLKDKCIIIKGLTYNIVTIT